EIAGVLSRFGDKISARISVPSTELAGLLKQVPQDSMWHAGPADGRVRLLLSEAENDPGTTLQNLRSHAESLGGSLIIERAPAPIKSRIGAWGNLGKRGELMQRIKQQLDPRNVLSPGRFGNKQRAE